MRHCIRLYLPWFQLGFECYLVEFSGILEYLIFDPKYVHAIAWLSVADNQSCSLSLEVERSYDRPRSLSPL
jgi:hypothetical protein